VLEGSRHLEQSENFTLLEAITRERLVKTQQAGKVFVDAALIFEVWKLVTALLLLVSPSYVLDRSINTTCIPNPRL
jgi:hypothetical protein